MDRQPTTLRESVLAKWRAQSPTAKPRQEGVAETSVSAGMGSRETGGPAGGSSWGRVTDPSPSKAAKGNFRWKRRK
jgi:hypothetical protein